LVTWTIPAVTWTAPGCRQLVSAAIRPTSVATPGGVRWVAWAILGVIKVGCVLTHTTSNDVSGKCPNPTSRVATSTHRYVPRPHATCSSTRCHVASSYEAKDMLYLMDTSPSDILQFYFLPPHKSEEWRLSAVAVVSPTRRACARARKGGGT
jgi:hypothetical protein